jgi:hypothetical protein
MEGKNTIGNCEQWKITSGVGQVQYEDAVGITTRFAQSQSSCPQAGKALRSACDNFQDVCLEPPDGPPGYFLWSILRVDPILYQGLTC